MLSYISFSLITYTRHPHTHHINRFLMNNKKEMSVEELKDLLMDNEITNFDPVAEAYRVFDQHGEGALSGDKLRQVRVCVTFCCIREVFIRFYAIDVATKLICVC